MDGPTHRWLQMIADEVVKPCRHSNCNKDAVGKFQLVEKCYQAVEPVKLDIKKPQKAYFQTDYYETADCCKLDSEKLLKGHITHYGFTVTRDILRQEIEYAELREFRQQLLDDEVEWKKAFIGEMRLLVQDSLNPQQLNKGNLPYLDAYEDAAEWRHLDRQ